MNRKLIKDLMDAIKASDRKKTSGYDTSAVVRRIEDGTAWVHIPGGVDETPVKLTINASVGDTVQVRVSGGRAFLVGNRTAPPTDDTTAIKATYVAKNAQETAVEAKSEASEAWHYAGTAKEAAESAQDSADSAAEAATEAWNHADDAHQAAVSANNSANNALVQLSVVEDVAGTLRWISEHGSYVPTTDTTVIEGSVYFIYENGDYVPIANPDPSANPSQEGWYVLDVTESQAKYIMAHLAVTSAGLWVLPVNQLAEHPLVDSDDNQIIDSDNNPIVDFSEDPQHASGYKVLLSGTGMTVYNNEGAAVANYGETTTVGKEYDYNVHITSNEVQIRNGTTVLAKYGATTKFYEPDGTTEAAEISANGLIIKEGIIKLGSKESSSDMTNPGTYIDTDGNIATSNIKAHGGTIGGFNVTSSGLRGRDPSTNKVIVMKPSGWAFAAGGSTHETYSGCPFRVSIDGALYASKGQIAGWDITEDGMYYPDENAPDASIERTRATFGNSWGYVSIGAVGNTAGTWGIQASDEYNFSIENGVTNIVMGVQSAVVRPVQGDDISRGTIGHKFLHVYCTDGAFNGSDLKQKSVIDDFDWKVDDFIQGLHPIAYKRIWKDGTKSNRIRLGFGAQDVAKLAKDLGIGDLSLYNATVIEENENGEAIEKDYHGEEIDDRKLSWSLSYTELIAPMVLEIQKLMKRVDELESRLAKEGE